MLVQSGPLPAPCLHICPCCPQLVQRPPPRLCLLARPGAHGLILEMTGAQLLSHWRGGRRHSEGCESLKQALLTPFPALSGSPHCWGPFVTVQETFGTGVVPETRGHQVLSGWALCWHPASWKKVPMFRGLCECVRPWDMWSILGLPEGKCFSGLTLFCGLWCLLQQRTIWCKDFILGHEDTV